MRALYPILFLAFALSACGKEETDDTSVTDTDADTDANCTDPTTPACFDDMIMDLSLHTDASDADVTTTADGDDFVTVVDATAGGYSSASRNPWVYVAFDADGAHRVDVDDETAAESSMDWHMSLRRYNIRLNGGDSGPSCVGSYKVPSSTYEDVTSVPGSASFTLEDFYTDECELTADSHDLGDPDYAMNLWWDYSAAGCVSTSLYPYLLQLADGRILKVVVEAYYQTGQDACNSGASSGWGESAWITLRWRFLQ